MSDILFVDTETGGLDAQTDALLSVGLVHWRDGQILSEKEILVQPEGRQVKQSALAVNKINLSTHQRRAKPRRVAAEEFVRYCNEEFHYAQDRIILGGHNVMFDVNFVRPILGQVYSRIFIPRVLDTSSILQFLWNTQVLPNLVSLDQALRYFGIECEVKARHTALGDAKATAELYTQLVRLSAGVV